MSLPQTCLSDVANSKTIPRKTANFHPSLWGDFFITFTCDHTVALAQFAKAPSHDNAVENLPSDSRIKD
ncbi:hypothetical protein RND81_04G196000 [Saponaria officinalis]|uniref:Uncharacterized protein n=1 Tax=Saponaria officinalis TaxID=3572 RepID=A0AAW1LNT8_SAPOF